MRSLQYASLPGLIALLFALLPLAAYAAPTRPTVLAQGFGKPDDLAWGPHGAIYFSDFGNSAVNRLDPDGRRTVVWAQLDEPEGIVVEPNGSLDVVEQGPNRIDHLDLVHHRLRVLATLPDPRGQLGIDAIARDPRDGSLLIPDSPTGRLLRLLPSGQLRVIATGLGRPVDALPARGGTILVVDEHLNAAFRIAQDGRWTRFGGFLSVPDDIVSDGHGGYDVSCLGDGTIRHIAADGITRLAATGLPNPQGLLRRSDGTLIVAQEDTNRLVALQSQLP